MPLNPGSAWARAQAALVVLAVTVGLAVAPSLLSSAAAAPARPDAGSAASVTSDCAAAQASVKKAKKANAAAHQKVVKAKKALKKAQKAHKPKKVKKAKKALAKAKKRYAATKRAVANRQQHARSACATPPSNNPSPGENTGKKISLLGLGNGLDLGSVDATQLTALLEQLLPGITDQLSASQLSALLAGFNAGSDLDPADALALLTGVLDPSSITDLLGGSASPEALQGLIEDIVGQLSGMAGNFPIPSGSFDPAGLWDTFAGIFGTLSSGQLGSLLAMLTSALGNSSGSFDAGQLTDLIDSLVPGISEQFDGDQLASMLAGINGQGLSASTLANLLGGQFSPAQLQSVINGTAGQALLGSVIAQVVAQLGTAGAGGLELPGPLNAGSIAGLISTVTNLFTSVLGGGSITPIVCGLIPIPVLCP